MSSIQESIALVIKLLNTAASTLQAIPVDDGVGGSPGDPIDPGPGPGTGFPLAHFFDSHYFDPHYFDRRYFG